MSINCDLIEFCARQNSYPPPCASVENKETRREYQLKDDSATIINTCHRVMYSTRYAHNVPRIRTQRSAFTMQRLNYPDAVFPFGAARMLRYRIPGLFLISAAIDLFLLTTRTHRRIDSPSFFRHVLFNPCPIPNILSRKKYLLQNIIDKLNWNLLQEFSLLRIEEVYKFRLKKTFKEHFKDI